MRTLPGCIGYHTLWVRDMRAYPFRQAFSTQNVCSAWHACSATQWVRDLRDMHAVCDLRAARDMRPVGPYICLLPQSFSPTGQCGHTPMTCVQRACVQCVTCVQCDKVYVTCMQRVTCMFWAIHMPATTQLLSQWDTEWMGWWWQGTSSGVWHACNAFHAPSTATHDDFFPVHCVNWCHWRNFG